MGPLLALECPCFRKNVIFTCKIVFVVVVVVFLSFDNFLLKYVIVLISGKLGLKLRSFVKTGYFDLLFIF